MSHPVSTPLPRAERRAAPKPARIPSGDRTTYPSDEGLCVTRRRLLGGAAAWALAPAIAGAAEPGVDAPPLAAPPRPVRLPPIESRTLASGMTLVVVPQPGLPLVSLTLLLRGGPEFDRPGKSGLVALTTGMLAKGTRRAGRAVDATAIARQAEALGSTLDIGCSWRASTLSMTVTTPKLAPALALVGDVARRPLLAEAELARLRAQQIDALRVAFGDPAALAGMLMRRSAWGASPYGGVVTPASLQRITVGDLWRCHTEIARPELAALVLVGDIDIATAQPLVERVFGHWNPPQPAPLSAPLQPPQPAFGEPLLLLDLPGAGQSVVAVAAPFVASQAADRRAGQLASAVLGGGFSGRLNQAVRIRRGLSYGASAEADSQPAGGVLVAQAQTRHDAAVEVQRLLRDELLRLATEPPTADELAARQAGLVGGLARRQQTTAGLAALVVGQLAQERPLAALGRAVDEILAVTPAQVAAFAQQHWPASALRSVVVGDLRAGGGGWPAEGVRRLTLDTLDLEQPDVQRRR